MTYKHDQSENLCYMTASIDDFSIFPPISAHCGLLLGILKYYVVKFGSVKTSNLLLLSGVNLMGFRAVFTVFLWAVILESFSNLSVLFYCATSQVGLGGDYLYFNSRNAVLSRNSMNVQLVKVYYVVT